ncbi:hypothetical protein J8C02_13395 [Chloracidobacterium sp. MS 40/45]|uniref:hypothetical protein n=1 Tax=Chloracidobacterium aggregatum TaxID=2851959 RepID=UPI001B8C8096|nr:hypothetical protein [Chloracidobacterium aggregatum]QUW01140.1 hypothetical protein J8C02_13395 [Chloracidobacterium sp. MS 40/45]
MPHPVVDAIRNGAAPRAAKLAAANGLLPLPPDDSLLVLSTLVHDSDEEIRAAAQASVTKLDPAVVLPIARDDRTDPAILSLLCTANGDPAITEAVTLNRATPDAAIETLALKTTHPHIIEALTVNQQRLIRRPALIEAILHNPHRTPEAERRAREVKAEFLEKEFGRRQVAGERTTVTPEAPLKSAAELIPEAFVDAPPVTPTPPPAPPSPSPVTASTSSGVSAPPPPAKPLKLSKSPPVAMIQQGKAPRPAKLMVAQGKLPLAPEDMLFAQVLLTADADAEIAEAARTSLATLDFDALQPVAQDPETPEEVLRYLLLHADLPERFGEQLLLHPALPDESVLEFVRQTTSGYLLEAVTINQQRLIRLPALLDAILANPASTFEAIRKAREIKTEFFEKELGAERIAREQKARAAKFAAVLDLPPMPDEAFEAEFQSVLAGFEAEVGQSFSDAAPSEADADADFEAMLAAVKSEEGIDLLQSTDPQTQERLSVYQALARMSVKERIFAALKGGRDVRAILIRDSNRMVSTAVVKNPRISDAEIEAIANIKGINEDVLRIIAMNRAWVSNYAIMHNLVRNARCPLNFSMQFINRLQSRDLVNLTKSKSIPDALRQAANRLVVKRRETGG